MSSAFPVPQLWHWDASHQAPHHLSVKSSYPLLLLAPLAVLLCPPGISPGVGIPTQALQVGWDRRLGSYREFSALRRKQTSGTAMGAGEWWLEHHGHGKMSKGSWAPAFGRQTTLSLKVTSLNNVFPWANILGPVLKKLSRWQCYCFQRVHVQHRIKLFEPGEGSTVNKRVKRRNKLR